MLGYYLITREDINKYLKWFLIILWDMIGLVIVMLVFIVYRQNTKLGTIYTFCILVVNLIIGLSLKKFEKLRINKFRR